MQTPHPDGRSIVTGSESAEPNLCPEHSSGRIPASARRLFDVEFLSADDHRILSRFPEQKMVLTHWVLGYRFALELLRSNPVLLWFLVCIAEAEDWPDDQKQQILQSPQRTILKVLVSVDSKSAVRFVSRLQARRFGSRERGLILFALRVPPLRQQLSHFQEIPLKLLAFLRSFPEAGSMRLLASVARQLPDEISAVRTAACRQRNLYEDIERLGEAIDIPNCRQAVNGCRSLAELVALHDRWTQRLNGAPEPEAEPTRIAVVREVPVRNQVKPAPRVTLGPPPLPGTASIRPIRTVEELREEGRLMEHCVGSYVNSVANGDSYIYKVLRPQRATLQIRINPRLELGQCKLKNNNEPSSRTLDRVSRWFEAELEKLKRDPAAEKSS